MGSILEPAELLRRIEIYLKEEIRAGRLSKGSFPLLREAVLSGQFERGKASSITGYRERVARVPLAKLIERGLFVSDGPKTPGSTGISFECCRAPVPCAVSPSPELAK